MAFPVYCPNCGVCVPPETYRCECGYDLMALQATSPPIQRYSLSHPLAPTNNIQNEQDQIHHERETLTPQSTRKSYFRRHWQGELSLRQSYWVNTFLLSFLFQIPFYGAQPDRFDELITTSPRIVGALVVLGWLFLFVLAIWQYVGLWRSACSHILKTGRSLWGRTAQALVVVGIIVSLNTLVTTAWPQIMEFGQITFGLGDYGGYTVRVIRQGKEIEVAGAMVFGVTEEVKKQLEANPEIRAIHLNSPGGRIAEARTLRDLIKSKNLVTYSSQGCQSACASAFMGGSERLINRNARLGFHKPRFPGLTSIQTNDLTEAEKRYFLSRGVDEDFVRKAFSTPNNDMWLPSPDELLQARVITGITDGEQFAMTESGVSATIKDLENSLLQISAFQSIKRHDPATFQTILSEMEKGINRQVTKAEMVASIRNQTSKLYARYLPVSEGNALLNATRKMVETISILERANPEACYSFLFSGEPYTDFQSLLSDEVKNALVDSMASVIETGVSNPQVVPRESQVKDQLELVMGVLLKRYGEDIALLSNPSTQSIDKGKVCSMAGALYKQVLSLPRKESVQLLRFLYASS